MELSESPYEAMRRKIRERKVKAIPSKSQQKRIGVQKASKKKAGASTTK